MNAAHSLIAAFHELNNTENKAIADFTPSLIGMFGSAAIFDSFLSEIDKAMTAGAMPSSLKKRAANLIGTFIPQVAEYNSIKNPAERGVSAKELINISKESLASRRDGVAVILAGLLTILKEASEID